jgi:hypothetical protein
MQIIADRPEAPSAIRSDLGAIFMGTSKNFPLWCDDWRSSSQRGRSFNPWPLIEVVLKSPPVYRAAALLDSLT